jgi:hypothetical protein
MEINHIGVAEPPVKMVFNSNFYWGTLIVTLITIIGYYVGSYFYGWGFKKCGDGVKFVVDAGAEAAGTGLVGN